MINMESTCKRDNSSDKNEPTLNGIAPVLSLCFTKMS